MASSTAEDSDDVEQAIRLVQSGFEVAVALADSFVLPAQPFGFHARGESHDHLPYRCPTTSNGRKSQNATPCTPYT